MNFSCGCIPAPNTHFLPNMGRGNGTLFTITGSSLTTPYMGNSIMGGNFGRCCNGGSIFNGGYNPMFGGFQNGGIFGGFRNPFGNCGCNFGGFGNPFGNFGGNFGNFRFPFF